MLPPSLPINVTSFSPNDSGVNDGVEKWPRLCFIVVTPGTVSTGVIKCTFLSSATQVCFLQLLIYKKQQIQQNIIHKNSLEANDVFTTYSFFIAKWIGFQPGLIFTNERGKKRQSD